LSETLERPLAAPPAKKDSRPIREVAKVADLFTNAEFIHRIEKAVTGQVNTSLMLSALAGSFRRSPAMAECNVMDVAGKALLLAQAGLLPDTALQHAHLIPFKEKTWNPATKKQEERYVCQAIIGYHGLLDLAYRSGKVSSCIGRVAWRDEVDQRMFEFQLGTDEFLKHIPSSRLRDLSAEAQANGSAEMPAFAYAIAQVGSSRPFEVWPMSKVIAIRDATPAYSYARFVLSKARENSSRTPAGFAKTPWVAYLEKMAAKTMVRQLLNWLPRSIEYAAVAGLDEAQEHRSIDLGPIIDSTDYVSAAADAAEMSNDPGATYGYRADGEPDMPPAPPPEDPPQEPRQQPRQERQQRAPRQAAAKPPEPPQPPPAPPEAPPATGFDDWLLDEQGDPTGDTSITDPIAFAKALETLWAASNNKEGLLEQNRDAMEAASVVSPTAANIIESMRKLVMVQLKQGRDGPVWIDYIRDFKTTAQTIAAIDFMDFYAANKPIIDQAPPSTLSLLVKAIVERCKALSITPPQGLTDRLQQAASKAPANDPTPDDIKDRRVADNILDEIARINDANMLGIYSTRDAVKVPRARWKAEGKEALFDEITKAFHDRMEEIKKAPTA